LFEPKNKERDAIITNKIWLKIQKDITVSKVRYIEATVINHLQAPKIFLFLGADAILEPTEQ
jgi:hypothetical protein